MYSFFNIHTMKWTQIEIDNAISFLKEGKSYKEIGEILGKTPDSIRNKMNKNKEKSSNYFIKKEVILRECKECGEPYEDIEHRKNRKFCSQSCNALYNNRLRGFKLKDKIKKKCICGSETLNKFCSRDCYYFSLKNEVIYKIKNNVACHERTLKKYLIDTHGEKCMECGWYKIHPVTGKVPIQLDHIDGNFENNCLDNLRLLCPNCHSLTPTFGALNKGNGRIKERHRNKKQI